MALIRGEAGIGKTRLTEEVTRRVQSRGIVAVSRAYMAEGRLAYSPVADWLANPLLCAKLGRLESAWMRELARLVPDLLIERPDVCAPSPAMDANQRRHFLEAISRGILAFGEPTLLVLDDMQWCDSETLEWLHFLLRFAPQAPLLVLGTVRSEEVSESGAIATLIRTLQRREQITEISLGRLNESQTGVLAAHVDSRCEPSWNAALYEQTEGVPLFIVEVIRSGLASNACFAPGRAASPDAVFEPDPVVPIRIRSIVEHRLSLLSPEAREIADIAAIAGRSFAVDLLQLASGFSGEALLLALDELWRRCVIREHGPDSYDFTHDKIREVAASRASKARRCHYHARVAAAGRKPRS
jgi:predicted ATPase